MPRGDGGGLPSYRAAASYAEAMGIGHHVLALLDTAALALAPADPERAARLIGRRDAFFESQGREAAHDERVLHQHAVDAVVAGLDPRQYDTLVDEGRYLDVFSLIADAESAATAISDGPTAR